MSRFFEGKGGKKIYVPTPTWGNHIPIFRDSGLEVLHYRYFDKRTNGLDFAGMMEDLKVSAFDHCFLPTKQKIPDESVVLLHACAHNPTGVDPNFEQWRELSDLLNKKRHTPFFDMAYQGFASGDCDTDAFAIRHFVKEGHKILLSQVCSFLRELLNCKVLFQEHGPVWRACGSLFHRERQRRTGYQLCDACKRYLNTTAKRSDSQVKILIRPMYSNPPISGPRIVKHVLSDGLLMSEWYPRYPYISYHNTRKGSRR